MNRILLTLAVVLSVSAAGRAVACGYDECDPNNACSDYSVPCEAASYIDDAYGPRSNFRLLLNTYASVKETTTSPYPADSSEEFAHYQQKINAILDQKHLDAVPVQYKPSYAYGAHPCLSNNYENALAFMELAADDPKTASFLRNLILVRDNILHLCANPGGELKTSLEKSLVELKQQNGAAEYATYLNALYYFYTGDYRKAVEYYQHLGAAASPWIRETATYLVGRSYLVLSQEKWNGWDSLKAIDRETLNKAEASYKKYLTLYPDGRYSSSARNIQRRILFLRQDVGQLNNELERLFEAALQKKGSDSLGQVANEVLTCYQADKVTFGSPLITAYQLILGVVPSSEDLSTIRKNKDRYAKYPGLQAFLINKSLFRQKRYQDIIDGHVMETEGKVNAVTMALHTLYAESYEQLGKYGEARKVWKQTAELSGLGTYQNFFQIALAHNYLKDHKIELIATAGSGVTNAKLIREIFENLASDKLLEDAMFSEKTATETKTIAQGVLLTRYVLQKRYPDLLKILKWVKDPGIFAEVETAAQTLIKNESDPKGLLNAGYFVYYHGMHSRGCGTSGMVGKYQAQYNVELDRDSLDPPVEYFITALEQFSEQDRSEVEAKLLYYAIISFKPSGKSYDFTWGSSHSDLNNGKEWYEKLHRKYPSSEWAKKTKYYY